MSIVSAFRKISNFGRVLQKSRVDTADTRAYIRKRIRLSCASITTITVSCSMAAYVVQAKEVVVNYNLVLVS
jgi:hypothetical protein